MEDAATSLEASGLGTDRRESPNLLDDSPDGFDEVRPNQKWSEAADPSIAHFGNESIKEVSKGNNKYIPFEVKLWVEQYKKDPKPAIADLLTMSFENFKVALDLPQAGYFGPEDKETLRSCVQAINFCTTESKGELQGFVLDKLKEPEDELVSKLESALKEAAEDVDDHLLIVNLKRLYELQLSKSVPIERLFPEFSNAVEKFRSTNEEAVSFLLINMYLHLSWSLHSIVNCEDPSTTSLSSLCSERDTLLEHLGYFLDSSQCEGEVKVGNQLAFRVCLILADLWYLFRKANFSSKKFETLGFAPDQSAFKLFRQLCEQQLNISNENEEEDLSKAYIDLTNSDIVLLAAGKLIVTDTAPMVYFGLEPEVILNLSGTSAAEIIKAVIRNKVDICDMCVETLKRAYRRHQNEVSSGDEKSAKRTLLDCKTRSVQLCETAMHCEGSVHIHDILKVVMKCVEYAFTNLPNHLSFLEYGVVDFVSKLSATDVLGILKDVEERANKINNYNDSSVWRPYYYFLEVLQFAVTSSELYGTTAIGIHYEGGYILCVDSRGSNEIAVEGKKTLNDLNIDDDRDKFYNISSHIKGIMVGRVPSCKQLRDELISQCSEKDIVDVIEHLEGYFERQKDWQKQNNKRFSFGTIVCGSKPGSPCQHFSIYIHEHNIGRTKDVFTTLGTGGKHVSVLADSLVEDKGATDPRKFEMPLQECIKFLEKCMLHASLCDRSTGGSMNVWYQIDGEWKEHPKRFVLDVYVDYFDDYEEEPVLFLIVNKKSAKNLISADLIRWFSEFGEITHAHRICEICVEGIPPFYFHRLACKKSEDFTRILEHLSATGFPRKPNQYEKLDDLLRRFISYEYVIVNGEEIRVHVNKATKELLEYLHNLKGHETPEEISIGKV